jgi:hypothetical protein
MEISSFTTSISTVWALEGRQEEMEASNDKGEF